MSEIYEDCETRMTPSSATSNERLTRSFCTLSFIYYVVSCFFSLNAKGMVVHMSIHSLLVTDRRFAWLGVLFSVR